MIEYSKTRLLSNISKLAKDKGLKIKDIEEAGNLSPGYISRISKEDVNTQIGISSLVNISNILEVSLDSLLKTDFNSITPTEELISNFLGKLCSDTTNGTLIWTRQSQSDFAAIKITKSHFTDHPLFIPKDEPIYDPEYDKTFYKTIPAYKSLFFPNDRFVPYGDSFFTAISKQQTVYLMQLQPCDNEDLRFSNPVYEIYIVRGNIAYKVCNSIGHFENYIRDIYNIAIESSRHVNLSSSEKELISAYIGGTSNKIDDDYFDIPF